MLDAALPWAVALFSLHVAGCLVMRSPGGRAVVYELCCCLPTLATSCISLSMLADGSWAALASSHWQRMYDFDDSVQRIAIITLAYETWNVLVTAAGVGSPCTPAFIGHHVATATLAYFGLAPYLHFYGAFFMGLSSISTMFLIPVNILRANEEVAQAYPRLALGVRAGFAVSFVALRALCWPIVSFFFWSDSLTLLWSGRAHDPRVVVLFLMCNVPLTVLQVVWARKVVQGVRKALWQHAASD